MRIVSIGEILWDVFDDGERIGGAPFNLAVHVRRLGHEVWFVSAVGRDELGERALDELQAEGLPVACVTVTDRATTGTVLVSVDAEGEPSYEIVRPAAYDFPALPDDLFDDIVAAGPDCIAFGTLAQASPRVRDLTASLASACPSAIRFYDVNFRRGATERRLVEQLLAEATCLKLNEDEVALVRKFAGHGGEPSAEFWPETAGRFGWRAVCVTRGERGCAVLLEGAYAEAPGYPVEVADTVGAGDAFAAAFLHGMSSGWSPHDVGDFANRLGALVASRSGGIPSWTMEDVHGLRRDAGRSPDAGSAFGGTPSPW